MANRIMLNETSYHGAGAIKEIATEAKARGFSKASRQEIDHVKSVLMGIAK